MVAPPGIRRAPLIVRLNALKRTHLNGISTHKTQEVAGSSPARPSKCFLQSLMIVMSYSANVLRNVSNARKLPATRDIVTVESRGDETSPDRERQARFPAREMEYVRARCVSPNMSFQPLPPFSHASVGNAPPLSLVSESGIVQTPGRGR